MELQKNEWDPVLHWIENRWVSIVHTLFYFIGNKKLTDCDVIHLHAFIFIFRYNVTIGSSSSILGPEISEATKDLFRQHLKSYNFWGLIGKKCQSTHIYDAKVLFCSMYNITNRL